MKKILITGRNSYIGTSLEEWLLREPDKYKVDTVSTRNNAWNRNSFFKYDVVFHVAGVAHIKESRHNQKIYYKVNRDLAYEVAKKAKEAGVKQFIFLSSMSVYGLENGVIDKATKLNPSSAYGKSKIEAEKLITNLETDSFIVTILRPPMVYGKGCKGNYPRLVGLALKIPVFPEFDNKRSMIYIDNLSEFIKQLIDKRNGGIFFPQNDAYVNTSETVKLIAEVHDKTIVMTKVFNPLLRLLNISTINKVFGDLVYDMKMSEYESDYRVVKFRESIKTTEEQQ